MKVSPSFTDSQTGNRIVHYYYLKAKINCIQKWNKSTISDTLFHYKFYFLIDSTIYGNYESAKVLCL